MDEQSRFPFQRGLDQRRAFALRARGAAVASVHPLMTFVRGTRPSIAGVPFAIEGDARRALCAGHRQAVARARLFYCQARQNRVSRLGNVRLAAADGFAGDDRTGRSGCGSGAERGAATNASHSGPDHRELCRPGRARNPQRPHCAGRCRHSEKAFASHCVESRQRTKFM